ncbi:MAG TPA: hypothetical protein VGG92_05155 [Caulobacteraceae bacterium]|jgi:hypothetical protein
MRLFHFSDNPGLKVFHPRPVRIPSPRPVGREWLNEPLVWAIEETRQAMYLFPRDCPRILVWPTEATVAEECAAWWGERRCAMIAHIEWAWFERWRRGVIHRYELPVDDFEDLQDAGMWVARRSVAPIDMTTIDDLPQALAEAGCELRVMESLTPLKGLWTSSLHVSGIRLRNAAGWAR